MARMRSIKPEFWADQDLTRLPRDVRLLYMALWNHCDEQARMQGDPRLVKSWCFPLDDDVTVAVIDTWLTDLEKAGKVVRYDVDGSQYIHLPRLGDHQKLDPRLPSRLPPPSVGVSTPLRPDQSVSTLSDPSSPADTGPPDDNTDSPQPVGVQHQPEGAKHVAGGREHEAGSMLPARADAPTAQTIVTEWIDRCPARPPNRVIGQVAKLVGEMLAEGIDPADTRRGLKAWMTKNLHPSTLPSVVNEVMNAPRNGPGSTKAAGWLTVDQLGGTA